MQPESLLLILGGFIVINGYLDSIYVRAAITSRRSGHSLDVQMIDPFRRHLHQIKDVVGLWPLD